MPETLLSVSTKRKKTKTLTIEWSRSRQKTGKRRSERLKCLRCRRGKRKKAGRSPRTRCVGTWRERRGPHQSEASYGSERSDSADEGGGITEAERERERELPRVPHSLSLPTAKSINMFDLPHPTSISLTSFSPNHQIKRTAESRCSRGPGKDHQ